MSVLPVTLYLFLSSLLVEWFAATLASLKVCILAENKKPFTNVELNTTSALANYTTEAVKKEEGTSRRETGTDEHRTRALQTSQVIMSQVRGGGPPTLTTILATNGMEMRLLSITKSLSRTLPLL
uniref:Uncharacterized protein n=1 Tax=Timema douglasi TaxID=61478 RepID=A0A7R8V9C4_TIMDO|nr:unnamed protein product [Timema douglasi]